MDTNPRLRTALALAGRGWKIIPLDGKHPFPGSRGHRDGTTSREEIKRWWREHPRALSDQRPAQPAALALDAAALWHTRPAPVSKSSLSKRGK